MQWNVGEQEKAICGRIQKNRESLRILAEHFKKFGCIGDAPFAYVLYNERANVPDREDLWLTDSFECQTEGMNGAIFANIKQIPK